METPNIDDLLEELSYYNHSDDEDRKYLRKIENDFNIEYIDLKVEKHNQLQYTYYYDIDFGEELPILSVEIENGINNGTRINHVDWESSTLPESRTVEILKDVIFCEESFNKWCNDKNISEDRKPKLEQVAVSLFERNKSELMQTNKNQSYDNYVTGGGTIVTNKYYKDFYSNLKEKGVFWQFIYEDREVDVNFV